MASDILLTTAPRKKLSAKVVSDLREQLLAGAMLPGSKLPTENRLTESFGVSRTVIREALATLAAEGLVEARQGAGVFVTDRADAMLGSMAAKASNKLSIALNVLEVRIPIEVESAGIAASRCSGSQEAAIQEVFFEFDRLLAAGEPTGPADFAFHRAIAEATNNPFYVEVLDALGRRTIPCDTTSPWATDRVTSREYQQGLQREHAVILAAISAGQAEEAREAMLAHLSTSQLRYRAQLRERARRYASISATKAS